MRNQGSQVEYMINTFPVEDEVLRLIRRELKADALEGVQVGASDARILQFLARLVGARKIVEVGTLYGYSALCWARAIPPEGVVYSLDSEPERHEKAKALLRLTPEFKKIQFITGDARVTLKPLSPHGPFDIIFIDADKLNYLEYLNWAEDNVRAGGLIIGDNTFLFGALFGESRDPEVSPSAKAAMLEFNRRLADPRRYNSAIIPTYEGITVAQRLG
jgi:caffeoyl-CoA O-methyltransferase